MAFRVRAVVEYDGTGYAGFQRQTRQPTIQAELEAVLRRLTGKATRVLYAGRTDAGVHAEGQVIAFDTDWRHPLGDLWRGMNALLSRSIAMLHMEVAESGFHPRFDAVSRLYRYRILNQPLRSPLQDRYAWHVPGALDLAAMGRATQSLVGTRDFATFGLPTQGESTIRAVQSVAWERAGRLICMEIEANAFLRHMVRSIVGSAVRVGLGESSVEEFVESFEARDRARSAPPAPPQGLYLVRVTYPDGVLAHKASQTGAEHLEGVVVK